MTDLIDDFQQAVGRTRATNDTRDTLALAAIGLAGETGEICDLIKKVLYHHHALERERLEEEIGDLCWYLATLCDVTGIRLAKALQGNLNKLRRRYPDGFNAERSRTRAAFEGPHD